jgi:hypothetical protein
MKTTNYADLMNYINIINERFNTLRLGVYTEGINADDNLYINYPNDNYFHDFTITGLTTILNTDPVIEDLTDGALYVAGGVNIQKNLYILNDVVNKDKCLSSSKNIKSNDIQIGIDFFSNINQFNILNCESIEMDDFNNDLIISNQIIINVSANLNVDPNTGVILNQPFLISNLIVLDNGLISVNGNSTAGVLNGNFDVSGSNISAININGYQINPNNVNIATNMLVKNYLYGNNLNITGIFKLNKSTATSSINNQFYLTGTTIKKNSTEIYTGNTSFDNQLTVNDVRMINNNNIFCNEIFLKFSVDTPIYSRPLCVNQTFNQLTSMSFFFQALETYCSFILGSDIVFENPSNNFKLLTYHFDLYSSNLLPCKPKYGFYFLVGGFRSSITTVYSVIYRFDFFDLNSSQINISIYYDSNNEYEFILGYVYTIYKFNCNYLI